MYPYGLGLLERFNIASFNLVKYGSSIFSRVFYSANLDNNIVQHYYPLCFASINWKALSIGYDGSSAFNTSS
jgi:hypothetical protein